MSILFNVWMLPILFILHDFEEMIFMPLWKKRHYQKLLSFKKPFLVLSHRVLPLQWVF